MRGHANFEKDMKFGVLLMFDIGGYERQRRGQISDTWWMGGWRT